MTDIHTDLPNLYENILNSLPGLIVVMDLRSRFIYSNAYTAKQFGYKSQEQMYGINAFGMRCPAAECAEDFMRQDAYVTTHSSTLSILDIHTYANNEQKLLLTKKSPIIKSDEIIGLICHCTELDTNVFKQFFSKLLAGDEMYYSDQKKNERSYVIDKLDIDTNLSKREQECIFYLCRGKTKKEIGKMLGISHRTVETYIDNVKLKWGCETKSAIVESAILKGFLAYIPKHVLMKNVSIPLN